MWKISTIALLGALTLAAKEKPPAPPAPPSVESRQIQLLVLKARVLQAEIDRLKAEAKVAFAAKALENAVGNAFANCEEADESFKCTKERAEK